MTNLWLPATIAVLFLLGLFCVELWRRTVVRKALSLSPELVALLTSTEISWLKNGLAAYLLTPHGATLQDDPRVISRLKLFVSIQEQRRDKATRIRRSRALKFAGLPPRDEQ